MIPRRAYDAACCRIKGKEDIKVILSNLPILFLRRKSAKELISSIPPLFTYHAVQRYLKKKQKEQKEPKVEVFIGKPQKQNGFSCGQSTKAFSPPLHLGLVFKRTATNKTNHSKKMVLFSLVDHPYPPPS